MSDDSTESPRAETAAHRQSNRGRRVVALVAAGLVVVAAALVGAVALFGAFGTSPSGGSAQPGGSSTSTSNPPVATEPTSGTVSSTVSPPAETTTAGDVVTFSPSDEEVFSTGTVKLGLRVNSRLDLIGWFAVDNYGDGHIVFTDTGLVGQNETQFALLDSGSDTSFATCRDRTAWTAAVNWSQVQRGSFACLRTFLGRRGILRIDEVPDFDENDPVTVLTGSVWETVVDR
jgi:hypothetical protein